MGSELGWNDAMNEARNLDLKRIASVVTLGEFGEATIGVVGTDLAIGAAMCADKKVVLCSPVF